MGDGQIIKKKCSECRGKKITKQKAELEIQVPKGVDNSQRMQFPKKGRIDPHTKKQGDLFVEFHVEMNPLFKREENDLFTDIPISYLEALLGSEVTVPTIDGLKTIEIAPNTVNNKIIRLKNYGAYNPNNQKQRGHHYIRIKIKFPTKLSQKEKELLRQMQSEKRFNPNEDFIDTAKRKG